MLNVLTRRGDSSAKRTLFALWACVALLAPSCASDPAPEQRVLDLKVACQERSRWNPNALAVCTECQSYATLPSCACPAARDFGGVCEAQASRQHGNIDCTMDVVACAQHCGTDCACVDACFAAHASCREDYAALSTCVLDTCTRYCQ